MTDQVRADTRPTTSDAGATGKAGGKPAPSNFAGEPVEGRIETVDALRAAIDGGAGGDKNPVLDPTMTALGTDDEAGGHSNTPAQIRMAAAHEIRPEVSHSPEERRPGIDGGMIALGVAIIALIGAAVVLV